MGLFGSSDRRLCNSRFRSLTVAELTFMAAMQVFRLRIRRRACLPQ